MTICEIDGHLFARTDPPCCIECSITITKYDLLQTKGDGRVFICGQLNDEEKKRFDKALRRGKMEQLERIMNKAFARLGYDVRDKQTQLQRPF